MARSSKLTPFHDLIGTVPDREIAVMADCAVATVHHYRRRHGITAHRATISAAPQPAAQAEVAPQAASVLQGFSVTLELPGGPVERTLIAESIVDAAQRASTAGRVLRITHLGRALV